MGKCMLLEIIVQLDIALDLIYRTVCPATRALLVRSSQHQVNQNNYLSECSWKRTFTSTFCLSVCHFFPVVSIILNSVNLKQGWNVTIHYTCLKGKLRHSAKAANINTLIGYFQFLRIFSRISWSNSTNQMIDFFPLEMLDQI